MSPDCVARCSAVCPRRSLASRSRVSGGQTVSSNDKISAPEAVAAAARGVPHLHSTCRRVSCSLFRNFPRLGSCSLGKLQMSILMKSSLVTRLGCRSTLWVRSSSRILGTNSLTQGFESKKGKRCLGPCCVSRVREAMKSSALVVGTEKLAACICCSSALEKCVSRHLSMILFVFCLTPPPGRRSGAGGPPGCGGRSPMPVPPAAAPPLFALCVPSMFLAISSIMSSSSSSTFKDSRRASSFCRGLGSAGFAAAGVSEAAAAGAAALRGEALPGSALGAGSAALAVALGAGSPAVAAACKASSSAGSRWILYQSHSSSALRSSLEIARLPRETCLGVRPSMFRRKTSAPASMSTCTTGTWHAWPARCSGVQRCEPPLRFTSKTRVHVRTRPLLGFFCAGGQAQLPFRQAPSTESVWLRTKQMPRSCPRRAARCSGAHLSLFIALQSAWCFSRIWPMAPARFPPLSKTDMSTCRGVLPSASVWFTSARPCISSMTMCGSKFTVATWRGDPKRPPPRLTSTPTFTRAEAMSGCSSRTATSSGE
mmetsp:Transcript_62272/g.172597  ORF Transcript_62272/g.172597 Transcript_62272/m.172597 type:complete len:541 (+) Transcript_62272:1241-2863(+)